MAILSPARTIYRNASLSNTVTLIRSGSSDILGVSLINPNASAVFLQFFDVANAADVTLGTTAHTSVIQLPAGGQVIFTDVRPWRVYANGLAVAVTTTATGSTAPASGLDTEIEYN